MTAEKIVFVDTETGGLDSAVHSLLSVAFLIWENGVFLDKREFHINDGKLFANPEALKINKIDLEFHKSISLSPRDALYEINIFLNKYFPLEEKITLCGHNIFFDLSFLKTFWKKNNHDFSKRFSHRYIDTSSILHFLYLTGKVNSKIISSQAAFDFFKIKIQNRHSALGDVIATAELFNKLIGRISSEINNPNFNHA
ncbi:MAG: exonuclease domain-containing protein [Rufibacter sp.]